MRLKKILFLLLNFISFACSDHTNDQIQDGVGLFDGKSIIDLSHDYSDETVYWVTAEEFDLDTVAYGDTEGGYFYSAFNFSTAEHGGTHVDAPIHFVKNAISVDEIPLGRLIGDAIKIKGGSGAPLRIIGIVDRYGSLLR